MVKYPMKFVVKGSAVPGINVNWHTSAEAVGAGLQAAIPPEFDGPGGGFSAEDFYALAIINCYISTFKVYAEKSQLLFSYVTAQVTLEVDRDEKGFPWMARAHLDVVLDKPSSKELGQKILEKAVKGCLVMNSIKTDKTVNLQIAE
ncbi:MAG: OsmC family protein [Bdellovibrio sp.]|nr:OsmC family protein [Bdellovibrio sp.]